MGERSEAVFHERLQRPISLGKRRGEVLARWSLSGKISTIKEYCDMDIGLKKTVEFMAAVARSGKHRHIEGIEFLDADNIAAWLAGCFLKAGAHVRFVVNRILPDQAHYHVFLEVEHPVEKGIWIPVDPSSFWASGKREVVGRFEVTQTE